MLTAALLTVYTELTVLLTTHPLRPTDMGLNPVLIWAYSALSPASFPCFGRPIAKPTHTQTQTQTQMTNPTSPSHNHQIYPLRTPCNHTQPVSRPIMSQATADCWSNHEIGGPTVIAMFWPKTIRPNAQPVTRSGEDEVRMR